MVYVETDSFTTQDRVEDLTRQTYTDTTEVTQQACFDRMAQQAARVKAVLVRYGYDATIAEVLAASAEPDLTIKRLCDEANAFLAAAYLTMMVNVRDTETKVFDAYIAAAEAIIGSNEIGLDANAGVLGAFLLSLQTSGGSAVNTVIEIPVSELLHVTTMQT